MATHTDTTQTVDTAASTRPVPPADRNLTTLDIGLLWFGAAIAITEIWAGGLAPLTALGLGLGLVAIVIGRVIGNGLMAFMGEMGARTGLPGIVLTRPALGLWGSVVLAVLNVLQLVGWTGWMLFVGFLYCDILAASIGLPTAETQPAMRFVWVGVLTVMCTAWSLGGQQFWRTVQRASSVLLALLSVAMTAVVLSRYGLGNLLAGGGNPLGLLAGVDIVVVMSVSWVPLVADYARYAKTPAAGRSGTFWGYFVGGTWMYAVGLLVALAAQTESPDQMVVEVMSQAGYGWALLAVGLVLLSTVTTTFLDIFSTVVSAQGIFPRIGLRSGSVVVGGLGLVCALFLDVFSYQHFLEAIGLVFLPAFTVVILHYLTNRARFDDAGLLLAGVRSVNLAGVLAWLGGAAVYDMSGGWSKLNTVLGLFGGAVTGEAWTTGSSLPCILVSAASYLLLARLMSRGTQAATQGGGEG